MTYNTDLMLQVRNQIRMEPERHRQAAFESFCGTTRCIAGWAIFIATGQQVDVACNLGTSYWQHPETVGAKLLGLNEKEAGAIFYELDEGKALAKLDALIEKGKNQR
ncbi:hypothetical protein ACFY7C_19315 [Streptomyces sp. NPDC012769]|uniref:hypothetical protein n=1 Tax=Streptomyces sp. NPDC012769 TaxID=3364848 RepID=UPI0036B224AD